MASNEKWKSVSVNIDTYAKIIKIAQDEDRKIAPQISNLVKKENELYQTLNKKYGDGEIDPTKGEFIPTPVEQK